jgi:adenosylcobinamide-phosphate synthase
MSTGLMLSAASALVAVLALVIDRIVGYPGGLQRTIGHPVAWMGKLLDRLDSALNRPKASGAANRARGLLALCALLAATLVLAGPLALMLRLVPGGLLVEAILAAGLLSQRSLHDHVAKVADGLDQGLADGRAAVAHIVGRDPELLDEPGVARAALESLSENTSDGVTAPLLWLAVAGLPGIALYKAVNTADSMIGHRNARYRDFGWMAARLDDLVNLPASRLTGIVFALAALFRERGAGAAAVAAMHRDARRHVSPNAGWPEAAMAGALGIRLGGPRSYSGESVELAWMGDGRAQLSAADIRAGLGLYGTSLNILTALTVFWFALLWAIG